MTDGFAVLPTPINGLVQFQRQPFGDDRGSFERLFCREALAALGFSEPVAQVNHSITQTLGTIRGLHYQAPPCMEDKVVACVRGRVFDVAVDLRKGSPTFLKWHAAELTDSNHMGLMIPQGFAHGFQTLSDDAVLIYVHSQPYVPKASRGVHFADPALAIDWPVEVTRVSEADGSWPYIQDDFGGLDQ